MKKSAVAMMISAMLILSMALHGCGSSGDGNSAQLTTPKPDNEFKALLNTYTTTQDNAIINSFKPYLRSGDVVTVVIGNSNKQLNGGNDMTALTNRLTALHTALDSKGVIITVLTSRLDNVTTIANGISTKQASCIFYDYEPNFEPEYTNNDFSTALTNISEATKIARDKGFKGGAAPIGRGLFDKSLLNWNYGQIANQTDQMIVQLQSRLKYDYTHGYTDIPTYKKYATILMNQLKEAGSATEVFPQVTLLSKGNPNGAPLEYCKAGRKALHDMGFSGVSIWFGNDAIDNAVLLLQDWRTAQ